MVNLGSNKEIRPQLQLTFFTLSCFIIGTRASSALLCIQPSLSSAYARRRSRSGHPHENFSFDWSTSGFMYASITASLGKPRTRVKSLNLRKNLRSTEKSCILIAHCLVESGYFSGGWSFSGSNWASSSTNSLLSKPTMRKQQI